MEAFKVSNQLQGLVDAYPGARLLREVAADGGEVSRIAIARLWLSEGIPYAFKDCPGIYEALRTWLGGRINVDPKEIYVTGSARLGQSLSPHQVGKQFDEESDLDLFIVSENLFDRMRQDFNSWSYNFENGNINASNPREHKFWQDNIVRGPRLIARGFIDSKLVPNYESYPTIKNIAQSMWLLKGKLDKTESAPKVSYATIRCYRSWEHFVRQTVLSLE